MSKESRQAARDERAAAKQAWLQERGDAMRMTLYGTTEPTDEQREALEAKHKANARAASNHRKEVKRQRRMTVGGVVVGGLVGGPLGALGLGVAENALNKPTDPTGKDAA